MGTAHILLLLVSSALGKMPGTYQAIYKYINTWGLIDIKLVTYSLFNLSPSKREMC